MGEDIDSLFITGGLAARETRTGHEPDAAALERYLARETIAPDYAIGFLRPTDSGLILLRYAK